MPTQLLIIHGGETFPTTADYLNFLKTYQLDPDDVVFSTGWKDVLPTTLGPDFEVIKPRMPNALNARYDEWKIWFEKYLPFLRDEVILLGHSLGGIFLAKYLSENDFPVKIKSTILVAAPFEDCPESLCEFNFSTNLEKLAKQGGEIIIFHSRDDKVVPFSHAEKFLAVLPKARLVEFVDRGHFNQESFPELVKRLK